MKRIYIAGPYSSDNVVSVLHNIRKGIEAAYEVFCMGYAPFCPWLDFHFVLMDQAGILTLQMFYDYSIAWLKVSDAMIVLDGWENSKGTIKEIEIAEKYDIPVYYGLDKFLEYERRP